ncbi:MAG: TrkA family potassium uptake protein [Acidobacteria bacterium]|nr:TrkA family potassium uptake protein [Acidobacteriota bacterium]
MRIVIAGGGTTGIALARGLLADGHKISLIDRDPQVCDRLFRETGVLTYPGSATNISVLREAGIHRADAAAAMMRLDSDNLAMALLAHSFRVPQIMVKMVDQEFAEAYRLAGATAIVGVTDILISRMQAHIEMPLVRNLMRIGRGEVEVFEVDVPGGSHVSGRTVEEIVALEGFPQSCAFVALRRGEQVETARGKTLVTPDSSVIIICKHSERLDVVAFLVRPEIEPSRA